MQPGELEMDLTLAAVDFWEVGLGLRRTSCDLDPAFSIGVLLVHCYIIEKKINFYFCNVSTEDAGFRESFVERTQLLQCLRKPGLCTTSCSGFYHFLTSFYCVFHVQEVKPCPGAVVSSGDILKIRESLATVGAEAKSWDVTPVQREESCSSSF